MTKFMQKSLLLSTTCLLVCVAASLSNLSIALAQNPTQNSRTSGSDTIAKFECRGFSSTIVNITLKKNKTYTVQLRPAQSTNSPETLAGARYVSFRNGFRFQTGKLKNQSIVRQQNNIYLVATKNEARAAEIAAADGASFCTQQMKDSLY